MDVELKFVPLAIELHPVAVGELQFVPLGIELQFVEVEIELQFVEVETELHRSLPCRARTMLPLRHRIAPMLSPEQLHVAATQRPLDQLSALLDGISGRIAAADVGALDEATLTILADDLAVAALFAVEADSYQRPDQYVFANTGLSDAHVGAFLDGLFAREPAWRVGIVERLYAHHVMLRRARSRR